MSNLSIELVIGIAIVVILVIATIVYYIYRIYKSPYIEKMILAKSDRIDRFRFEDRGLVYKNITGDKNYVDVPLKPYNFKKDEKYRIGCAISQAEVFSDHYITGVAGLKIFVDSSYYCDVHMYINEINGKKLEKTVAYLKLPAGFNIQVYITKLNPYKKYYIKIEGPAFFLGLVEPFGNYLSLKELNHK